MASKASAGSPSSAQSPARAASRILVSLRMANANLGSAARRRQPKKGSHARTTMTEQRSEGHTSELQSLMRISYAVFCLKKKKNNNTDMKNSKYTSCILKRLNE